jgi:hypothetical protein
MSASQHRRHAWRLALIASAALALATVAVACGEPTAAASHRASPAARAGQSRTLADVHATGLPRYFADVVRVAGSATGAGPVQVRSALTGRLAARQPALNALAIAAYDRGRRLLLAETAGSGCTSRTYRATLTARGRLGKLTSIGPVIHGLVTSIAAAASGSLIGYFVWPCSKSATGYLAVLTARTGQVRRWTGVSVSGSAGRFVTGAALSMSADGGLVAFTGDATGSGGTVTGQRVWELRTSAPAGPIGAHIRTVLSRPTSGPALASVVLSPGASSFYLCTVTTKGTVSAHSTATQTAVVTVRRTATGASTGTVAKLTATGITVQDEGFGCPMAGDPAGGTLLVPYALHVASSAETGPVVRAARISLVRRTVAALSFRLPGSAGLSVATGISVAW